MGSSDNRSLPGFSLPVWMKHKGGVDRYEFEDIVSSPPTNDENFFYLRYPQVSRQAPRQSMYNRINELVEEDLKKSSHGAAAASASDLCSPALTSPSIEVTPPLDTAVSAMGNTTASTPSTSKVQSDSVIDVAQQMSKQMTIGPQVSTKVEPEKLDKPYSVFSQITQSLPPTPCETPTVTPVSSPQISRKVLPNPHHYFTGGSASASDKANSGSSSSGGGWFFSGLLSTNAQLITAKEGSADDTAITKKEETDEVDRKIIRRTESAQAVLQTESLVSVVQSAMSDHSGEGAKSVPTRMRPKPTELREMNFWSPTSM